MSVPKVGKPGFYQNGGEAFWKQGHMRNLWKRHVAQADAEGYGLVEMGERMKQEMANTPDALMSSWTHDALNTAARRHGFLRPSHHRYKLTHAEMAEARRMIKVGMRVAQVAAEFGVSHNTIYRMKRGDRPYRKAA